MKCDRKTMNRLKRAQGQMNGILKMMEDERSCEDIVTQLRATRSSIDKIIALITTENLMQTIESVQPLERKDSIDAALKLLIDSK
ncbi:MAG TPA: metal-sensing transcriptional repressor [Erysipelothrix sp.]|nr:metal-sensing transcriptional repressor [Erysipelothrix sp.]